MVAVGNNDFLGNKGDTLCRELQTRPAHRNPFAFLLPRKPNGFISCEQKADHCAASELPTQHNTTQ